MTQTLGSKEMKRIFPHLIVLNVGLLTLSISAAELSLRNEAADRLQQQIDKASNGATIDVDAGTYIGSLVLPEGISLNGRDVDRCLIIGDIQVMDLPSAEKISVLQNLTLFHAGGRGSTLISMSSSRVRIRNCILVSNGGFATVQANDGAHLTLRNTIVVGPVGGYAAFSRRNGTVEIANCTLVSRGFGVGLMDNSRAKIRDCLFTGSHKIAVIRTNAEYEISYCNISLGRGSFYGNHEFIDGSVRLRDPANYPDNPSPKELTNRDHGGYDNPGLTFREHHPPTKISLAAFRENQPEFAIDSGSPRAGGANNTLGAFGGVEPNW